MEISYVSKKHGLVSFLIDDEDLHLLDGKKFYTNKNKYVFVRNSHLEVRTSIAIHRLVLGLTRKDKVLVDHINGNKRDNRKSNLRICSNQQNSANQPPRYGGKGVKFDKRKNKFRARVVFAHKEYFIGYYDDEYTAKKAVDQVSYHLNGEFAWLNYPNEEIAEIVNIDKILNQKEYQLSNYNGVTKNGNRWRTRIRINNKLIHLGYFSLAEEAAKCYDDYVIEHNLNKKMFKLNFGE